MTRSAFSRATGNDDGDRRTLFFVYDRVPLITNRVPVPEETGENGLAKKRPSGETRANRPTRTDNQTTRAKELRGKEKEERRRARGGAVTTNQGPATDPKRAYLSPNKRHNVTRGIAERAQPRTRNKRGEKKGRQTEMR